MFVNKFYFKIVGLIVNCNMYKLFEIVWFVMGVVEIYLLVFKLK